MCFLRVRQLSCISTMSFITNPRVITTDSSISWIKTCLFLIKTIVQFVLVLLPFLSYPRHRAAALGCEEKKTSKSPPLPSFRDLQSPGAGKWGGGLGRGWSRHLKHHPRFSGSYAWFCFLQGVCQQKMNSTQQGVLKPQPCLWLTHLLLNPEGLAS